MTNEDKDGLEARKAWLRDQGGGSREGFRVPNRMVGRRVVPGGARETNVAEQLARRNGSVQAPISAGVVLSAMLVTLGTLILGMVFNLIAAVSLAWGLWSLIVEGLSLLNLFGIVFGAFWMLMAVLSILRRKR